MTATLLERPAIIDIPRPAAPVDLAAFHPRQGTVAHDVNPAGVNPAGVEPTGGRAGRRTAAFVVAGAAPVIGGAACALDVIPASVASMTALVPLLVVAVVAAATRIGGGRRWAGTGMVAGLASVAACYALELPLVASGISPDFVPALGTATAAATGSLWEVVGSGGVAMFAFLMVGLGLVVRPHLINRRTVAAGAGYLLFVWTGLMAALMLPGGPETAFTLSPAGFAVHLAYGALLAVGLPVAVRHLTLRRRTA